MTTIEDVAFHLMEQERINRLKALGKSELDYDSFLDTVPIAEIEKYLREKKLKNINKNEK